MPRLTRQAPLQAPLRLSLRLPLPVAAALIALAPAPALAHGGLNQSVDVVLVEGAPIVVSTFGLLSQADDGAWEWVCEEVAGAGSAAWTFAADTQVWTLATITGLLRSTDGCAWHPIDVGPLAGAYVTAVVPDPHRGGLWALTGAGDAANPLVWSGDDGQSWTEGPTLHPTARMRSMVVEPGGRLWAQGLDGATAWVFTAPDAETWTAIAVSDDAQTARVHAAAGGRAWVVVTGPDGGDTLYAVTPDGAVTPLLDGEPIRAVDAGPDRDEVWVGGRTRVTNRSVDGGATWAPVAALGATTCLRHDADARWACTDNWSDGAAVRTTPLDQPEGWTDALWFGEVRRVAPCPASSETALACEPLWDDLDPESGFDQVRDTALVSGLEPPAEGCGGCGGAAGVWLLPLLWLGGARRRIRPG